MISSVQPRIQIATKIYHDTFFFHSYLSKTQTLIGPWNNHKNELSHPNILLQYLLKKAKGAGFSLPGSFDWTALRYWGYKQINFENNNGSEDGEIGWREIISMLNIVNYHLTFDFCWYFENRWFFWGRCKELFCGEENFREKNVFTVLDKING